MKRTWLLCPAALALVTITTVQADDWTRFRGPDGLATSTETGLPVNWSEDQNLAWKTELPGMGSSSPITLGDRIYLTCYTGYGISQDSPGDKTALMRHVVCLDRNTGKILWHREFKPDQRAVGDYSGNGAWHGYSTSTPTTDGEHLFVFFGASGVYCLDLADGKEVWRADVGSATAGWGSGNSLLLYKDLLIVNASVESSSLVALDRKTGEAAWRTERIRGARNTPILVEVPGGKTELVVSLPQEVWGLDPETGDQLWTCEGIPDRGYVCPSVVAHDGVVYAIGGRQNTALAVKAGGRGDVTESHRLWKTGKGSNVASPVYHDGHLYWVHERSGIAYCLNAKTGDVVYEERLSPRPGITYSSATLADGKLYLVSQHAGAYVIAAQPKFELLAHNAFADDESRVNASPVISDGQLLLRSDKFLYCIGGKK